MQLKLLILLLIVSSCKNKTETSTKLETVSIEPKVVYNKEVYLKLWKKNKDLKVKIIDTSCINKTNRAKQDIKNNKLVYYYSNGFYEVNEMSQLLLKFHIKTQSYYPNHIEIGGFESDCYNKVMWREIDKRYGNNFIDSLWSIAEKEFVLKYPDSVYIKDGMDIRKKYIK